MPAKRNARFSQDDLDLIREMYTIMGEVKGILETVQEQTAENTRTLRGHNGTEGLVTRFVRMETSISDVDGKIEAVKTAIKDVPGAIDSWKRYPSLTWMVRHKFKEMTIITALATLAILIIGFPPDYYVGERVQRLIEMLFAKWLSL